MEGDKDSIRSEKYAKQNNIFTEKSVELTYKSYLNYIFAEPRNNYIFPLTILLFLSS